MAVSHGRARLGDYLSILRFRNIWLCCIGAVGFMTWLFVLNVFAPLYITQVAGQAPTTAGFLLGAGGLGSFFIGFLFPAWSDRAGRKPVLLLLAVMCTIVPLVLLSAPLYRTPLLLAGILFLTYGAQGVAPLILVLVPTETVPSRFAATSIGLATLFGEIFGATAAPVIAGALAEKHGLGLTMWLSAAGSALVFLVALLLRETARAKSAGTAGTD